MATLVLRSAGAALGTALGGPVGGLIGGALGAVGGAVVDNLLATALTSRRNRAPQLDTIAITHAEEGAPVRKLWGRMRVGGNVIWCTQFQAVTANQKSTSASGKGLGSTSKVTSFELSFAVAFCEGGDDVALGRVWADGNELDLSQYGYHFYAGAESQGPDDWIESVEGTGAVPAYRGTCYLVFNLMPLADFGNRMPQITAEIVRRPPIPDPDDVTNTLRAVCLLPGAGEFVLGTQVYQSSDGFGSWFPENVHTPNGIPDFHSSLDQLDTTLPGRSAVSLVVAWFGTDLRAGDCRIVPKVETSTTTVRPADWAVAGLTRATAQVVSQVSTATLDPTGLSGSAPSTAASAAGTVPAFGGTPSDDTVVQAIQAMNGRGLRVQFYPFVMMDVPSGNGLPDPYGQPEQAAYPWRGRVTCFPGPAQAGTADKSPAAADEVAAFFAAYTPMVLHYAGLCVAAGGVDSFVVGSELVGLTQLRSGPGDAPYPAVAALKSLAAQVKAILGPGCKVGYAADWTEYHAHRPTDGSNDVLFNMDPLWSDANIDFVGIDNYFPISDWRDGAPNLDEDPVNGPSTIYDKSYLQSNIEGGEDYAWFYATPADRVAQVRTPIVDTAHGQHWIFRQKDIRSWWTNAHQSRPGGVAEASSTAWVPQSKPLRFTEFGCPAVDKGPNQPNVFYDPKSSESSLPYFSTGSKDDPVQRAYLEATLSYWRDHAPTSSVYGGPMLSTADMYAWAWDARPFPDFPGRTAVWHDTPDYELGHWLTGRLGEVPLKWIIAELCAAAGVAGVDTSALMSPSTLVLGYATDALASPRDILAGLMDAHQFDARESGGQLQFFARGVVRVTALSVQNLAVEGATDPGYSVTRAGDTDLPGALRLTFADPYRGYASASVEARRATGNSQNVAQLATAAVLDPAYASDTATSLLQQVWAGRETGTVKLPPSLLALDAGDAVTLAFDGVVLPFRITVTDTATYRSAQLVGFDPSLLRVTSPPQPRAGRPKLGGYGPPVIAFVPLPPVTGAEPDLWAPRIAAFASPWCGIDVYRGNGGGGWDYAVTVEAPSVLGALTSPLFPGPVNRWDMGNTVSLRLFGGGQLLSLAEAQALAGAGALAIENAALGVWEVLQYRDAALVGPGSYDLTKLLRGQIGTEGAMGDPVPAGARVVVLDANSLAVLPMSLDQVGLVQRLRYGPSVFPPSDPTYTEVDLAFPATGLRPLSVSQVAGTRALPAQDVLFTWARRTRFAGDGWDVDAVPLNEEAELYDVEVTDGSGAVLRTVPSLPQPSWLYPAALQAADFGAPQPAYTVNVYQLSAVVGRGQGTTARVFP